MTILAPIPSQPGYLAGSDGHIYSTRHRFGVAPPRQMDERPTHDGYLRVRVSRGVHGKTHSIAVAVLVAEAFLGARPTSAHQVRHLNGRRQDNRPANLAYGTAKENAADRESHGNTVRGLANNKARYTDEEIRAAIRMRTAGVRQSDVARKYGVSDSTVARWMSGQCRGVVTPGGGLT